MSAGSRSAVVTGCGAGIGRAISEQLVADGWRVVGIERDGAVAAAAGAKGDVVVGDVVDRGVLEEACARAEALAPLGGWVNNAGIGTMGNLHDPDPAGIQRLLAVNLEAVFWGCSTAIRAFHARRAPGAIVNISSIHARASFPGFAAYDAAKGGVEALTRYIAVEYGPVGIRANAIAPGAIRTPMNQATFDASADPARAERELAELHPLGRLGEAVEIATVASFLLSPAASFVSGQSLGVDGGASARCFAYPPDPALLQHYGLS